MSLRITILGCGTSTGVPRIGPVWGACDPDNPKNWRSRCSLLVERRQGEGVTTVLVDTTPDLRQQLLAARVWWLDGVFYTHEHADHTHGIDDLRAVYFNGGRRVNVYFDARTGALLRQRFGYCFQSPEGSYYPPILEGHEIEAGKPVTIEGEGGAISVLPFLQHHGRMTSLGYRFGKVAYSPDIVALPEESYAALEGLDVWIVDALRYTSHPSHFSVDQALEAIARVRPKRAILTHMHIDVDYEEVQARLPDHVEPAFDGMVFEVDG
ncbi:MAG: MBL fold metallo-hydrolase [Alphaproteobacteria bacterium]|nr:MAG: MBL fold metallo-hydrolase [Alphaproteobacteria bacterium]